VIGFVVSAAVSAHERLTEFSLLRALGLSPRQLSGWLSLENGLLVLISLIGGTALGLLMAWMVLPFVTLTQDASTVVPGIIVAIPWGSILLLEGITIGALALVVLALAFLLRRVGLGTVLRLGEE
jgi:ABC-type antimicrobial peptide transport system permease subunit